jgi:pyruvate-formate lyase-activating enzyme
LILRNLARLQAERPSLLRVRVPLVPGITAMAENLSGIREFLAGIGVRSAVLLPYNPLGVEGRRRLGQQPPETPERMLSAVEERMAVSSFRPAGCQPEGVPDGSDRHPGGIRGRLAFD